MDQYSLESLLARAAAYFVIYFGLSVIVLGLYPRLFDIPHVGAIDDILLLIVPYLLAIIFFSLCVSVFIRNRESGLVLLISSSLIFLFMAGISWPKEMIPDAWWYIACCIPYTHGAHAFIHINSMGASLLHTNHFTASAMPEWIALWIQTGAYFLFACLLFFFRKRQGNKAAKQ